LGAGLQEQKAGETVRLAGPDDASVWACRQNGITFIALALCFVGSFSKEKRRKQMNPSTKDQIKGDLHQVKGGVKEKLGQVTNDPNLAADGQSEKLAGKVQKKIGQVEKVFEK